jgi:hypothetical protein
MQCLHVRWRILVQRSAPKEARRASRVNAGEMGLGLVSASLSRFSSPSSSFRAQC